MASVSVEKVMNDAVIALNANELHIKMLMNALKDAREKKKVLSEAVKEARANFKAKGNVKRSKAVSSGPRIYKDNAVNRKLGRVGKHIPSKKKKKDVSKPVAPKKEKKDVSKSVASKKEKNELTSPKKEKKEKKEPPHSKKESEVSYSDSDSDSDDF